MGIKTSTKMIKTAIGRAITDTMDSTDNMTACCSVDLLQPLLTPAF